ncbi:MAG: hypothetical protein ABI634_11570 [Acidobacteriota bacterium]
MRTVLMVVFGFEALLGIQRLAGFLPVAAAYDGTVWAMTGLRALVTLGQGITAMLLSRRAAQARPLGRAVVLASAVLLTLEIGLRLAPSSLAPGTREPVLATYWLYAAAVVWVLGRNRES